MAEPRPRRLAKSVDDGIDAPLPLGDWLQDRRGLVDFPRGPDARLQRPLNPRVVERRVLACEVDPTFRRHDVGLEARLLAGLEQSEGAAGVRVPVPGVGR